MRYIQVSDPKAILSSASWVKTTEHLPDETGWYLVYAPSYMPGSSSGKEYYDGIMISKFNLCKNGKTSWSAEKDFRNKKCVKFWMPLPNRPVCEDEPDVIEDIPGQLKFDF